MGQILNPDNTPLTPAQRRKAEELATVCKRLWIGSSTGRWGHVRMKQEPGTAQLIRHDGARV
jgi:hypothetical protein